MATALYSRLPNFMLASIVVAALTACSDPQPGVGPSYSGSAAELEGTPFCVEGCLDEDPSASSPGVFINTNVTGTKCFNGSQTDYDQDGVSDQCERLLAGAFAPELAMSSNDRTGREPKWVARKVGTNRVLILYLLSYFHDDGPSTSWCNQNVLDLFEREACAGHYGDSELIGVEVYYDTDSQHWLPQEVSYSTHQTYRVFSRGSNAYPMGLEYPSKAGSYPRAYVAFAKHANYESDAACDAGSIAGTDECYPNLWQRVYAGSDVSLGSRQVHTTAQDCMLAKDAVLKETGRTECYWTVKRFSGWTGGSPDASAYADRLITFGF